MTSILFFNICSLPELIQIELSTKVKTFCLIFSLFLTSESNFKHFEKKMTLVDDIFPKLQTAKGMVRKISK